MDAALREDPTVWFTMLGDDVLAAEGVAAADARLRFAAGPDRADALLAVTMDLTDELASILLRAAASRRRPAILVVTRSVAGEPLTRELSSGPVRLLPRRDATTSGIAALLHRIATERTTTDEPAVHLARLLAELRREGGPRGLDEREARLLVLLSDGADTAAIARDLHCSSHTVKRLVRELMQRYQARNRAHVVAHALQTGLI
ncbi:helix-turn-helix transcriptional regulator [Kutzneria sp. CA-103260]|uniref:helix-turn-helix transcriptional regulator n=1 Tax=Kutzneria sp. CA-103260 TaxID=2802641 RepID=UPI001BA5D8B1|nr:helix-turn-helix transcriptional regulator [Kutzneria sp. CA-103260]QUQ66086.1 LuxR family transcriptional regulator [Kutzneria sp. CA-103260]